MRVGGRTHLFGSVLVFRQLDHLSSHLVDTLDDGCSGSVSLRKVSTCIAQPELAFPETVALTQHLVVCDGAIAVNVIELERPSELLIQSSSRGDAESADELLKVNGAVFVLVEYIEDVFCKCGRIAEWEELLVDATELLLVERP